MEIEELKMEIESLAKAKSQAASASKEYEARLFEMTGKVDDAIRQLTDANAIKARLLEENLTFTRRVETLEFELTTLQTTYKRTQCDLDEARLQLESEMAVRIIFFSLFFIIVFCFYSDKSFITINSKINSNGLGISKITT